tara:strand:+ start:165 stop:815 length:651 start_codon:yes stop_codon:yes gene_type:complete
MLRVFEFLNDLKNHNNREWMQDNRQLYLESKEEVTELIQKLINEISQFDSGILGLQPKDCIFRINRDIRFSHNKDPYKNNFGAAITAGGRKTGNPSYYLHIAPEKSFFAGGMYMPSAGRLKKIRQEIDYNASELKAILWGDTFYKTFGAIRGQALKTCPRGYSSDHPDIMLLRLKSFLVKKDLTDRSFHSPHYFSRLISLSEMIYPFNKYLEVAIS